jgi:hypothetical protein
MIFSSHREMSTEKMGFSIQKDLRILEHQRYLEGARYCEKGMDNDICIIWWKIFKVQKYQNLLFH